MTVSSRGNPGSITYLRNPQNNSYDVPFKYLENDEYLQVFVRKLDGSQKQLLLDTDYTVTNSDGVNEVWGVVTMINPLPEDVNSLTIYRQISNDQSSTFDSETMFADTVERCIDKLTMLFQDNQFKQYTLHVSLDDQISGNNLEIPPIIERAGMFLHFDSEGNPDYVEGTDSNNQRSIRQPTVEDPDPSFVIDVLERAGNFVAFDVDGHLVLKKVYSAGTNITIDANNVISSRDSDAIRAIRQSDTETPDPSFVTTPEARAGNFVAFDVDGHLILKKVYSAGTNITIDANNVISSRELSNKVIIPAETWSDNVPFSNIIAVDNIDENSFPRISLGWDATIAQVNEWNKINKILVRNNIIICLAYSEKPTIDLDILVRI
jgi:hypothetical protein